MNRYLAAFLALLFASLTVSPACFAEPNGQVTLLVGYDDLDLSTPEGVKALHRRIELTASRVCLGVFGPSPGGQLDLGCRADAVTSARSQIADAIARQRSSRTAGNAATENAPAPVIRKIWR